jgi:phage FluMu protein Com
MLDGVPAFELLSFGLQDYPPRMAATLGEYRCSSCKSLLFKGVLIEGEVEARCKKCHGMNTFAASASDAYLCLVSPCPHRISLPSVAKKRLSTPPPQDIHT